MKNSIIKKALVSASAACTALAINAAVNFRAPIVLVSDGKSYTGSAQIEIPCAPEVAARAREILAAADNPEKLSQMLSSPKDLEKAQKFLSLLGGKGFQNVYAAQLGAHPCVFFKCESEKMRPGMNFFAFDKEGEKLLWNLSLRDPLLSVLAESAQKTTWKILRDVPTVTYPKILFANGELKNIDRDENVENEEVSKFYRTAQKYFLDLDFENYAKYYTPDSRKKLESQYFPLSTEEKKNLLSDYFSWKKKYLRIADAGNLKILFFERRKDGAKTQNGITWFEQKDGNFYISNFGPEKSLFERFLDAHFLSGHDYLQNFEKKFGRSLSK